MAAPPWSSRQEGTPRGPAAPPRAVAQKAQPDLDLGEKLLERARLAVNDLNIEAAKASLAQGRRALLDADAHADADAGPGWGRARRLDLGLRLTSAWVLFDEVSLTAATDLLRQVREESAAEGHGDLVALCDMQLGALRGRSGDLTGALEALRQAEESRGSLATVSQVRLLINRGGLLTHLGQLEAAVTDLAEAASLAVGAELPSLAFMAVHNHGCAQHALGDLPGALRLMEQADAMDVEVDRGIARLDRARVMVEAGLVDEAHELLLGAAQEVQAHGSPHDLGEIELDLARCEIVLGQGRSAALRAGQARRRFLRRGEQGWRRIAQVVELEAARAYPETASARDRLGAALQRSAERAGDVAVRQRAALARAEALVESGRAGEARPVLQDARALTRTPHLALRLRTRYVTAQLHALEGRTSAAVRTLRRAADDLGASARQAAGLDLRTALSLHSGPLVDLDMSLALRSGSPARVLARTEVWRDVVRTIPPVRTDPDARRSEVIGRLRRAREELRQAPPGEPDRRAQRDVLAAERAVRELDWVTAAAAGNGAEHGPMSAPAIRDAVRSRGVSLLSTLTNESEVYAVLVRPDGHASLHRLGRLHAITADVRATQADLAADARLPRGNPLGSMVRRSLRQHLDTLDHTLLAPVRAAGLEATPLVVVPTPLLMPLPWGMLPSRLARATTVARSATLWARRHTHLPRAPEVTAVAGPDVPLADREVASVVRAWGVGRAVPAQESTAQVVVSALRDRDVVHLAAHGEHHSQNPLFSSLRLSDGPVFAHEMEGHRLRATHVVLSACDAGRVSVRRGEEPLGMTASVLALGVPSVVAAGSPVPDAVAHPVMSDYHARLAAGVDAATALAQASAEGDLLARSFTSYGSSWVSRE